MRTRLLSIFFAVLSSPAAAQDKPAFPKFRTHEIDAGLSIGYAVLVADIDGRQVGALSLAGKHRFLVACRLSGNDDIPHRFGV